MDRVAMLDDELFATGSDNGSISLWSTTKKKPLFTVTLAHGLNPPPAASEMSADVRPNESLVPPAQPRWITALCAVPYSDLLLSGSWDGVIRIWRLSEDKRQLESVGHLGEYEKGEKTEKGPASNGSHVPPSMANGVGDEEERPEGTEAAATTADGTGSDARGGEEHPGRGPTPQNKFINGIINDIAVFERGDRGKDGLCIVAAVGKEHRLGSWQLLRSGGRNGMVILEVPRIQRGGVTNGIAPGDGP